MCWFRRRAERAPGFDETPDAIHTHNTFFEEVIEQFFAEVTEKAKDLAPGDEFEVDIDSTKVPEGVHPMVLVGPIMMRSHEHGVSPIMAHNWKIYLAKM